MTEQGKIAIAGIGALTVLSAIVLWRVENPLNAVGWALFAVFILAGGC